MKTLTGGAHPLQLGSSLSSARLRQVGEDHSSGISELGFLTQHQLTAGTQQCLVSTLQSEQQQFLVLQETFLSLGQWEGLGRSEEPVVWAAAPTSFPGCAWRAGAPQKSCLLLFLLD